MTDESNANSPTEQAPYRNKAAFWLTYILIILTTAAFVVSSYIGMNEILADIRSANSAKTASVIDILSVGPAQSQDLLAWTALEYDTLENRQSRANSLLATRTWLRFMNATFGTILVMAGAIFVLSRIEMGQANLEARQGSFKVVLVTSSPGIVMLLLGGLMAVAPLFAPQRIKTEDGASFSPPFIPFAQLEKAPHEVSLSDENRRRLCVADRADGIENSPYCE